MQIKDSKYHKVWKVEEKNGIKKVNLGDSKKNKDGSYDNWTWFDCMLVSSAKEVDIQEGDTITIVSGLVQKRKYEGKYYDNVVIFDLEVTKKSEVKGDEINPDDFASVEDDGTIPFN